MWLQKRQAVALVAVPCDLQKGKGIMQVGSSRAIATGQIAACDEPTRPESGTESATLQWPNLSE